MQEYLNGPTAFIEYSKNMDDVYDDINNYNKKRKRKVLIVFDDKQNHVKQKSTKSIKRIV